MNEEHVQTHSESVATWGFLVPSNAERCSEAMNEITALCEGLFEAFGDFVVPLRIQYQLQERPEGARVPHPSRDPPPRKVRTIDLRSEDGIGIATVVESFRGDSHASMYVSELPLERNRVKVWLGSGDEYLDRENSHTVPAMSDPADRGVWHDPLSIRLLHAPFDIEGVSTEFIYYLSVRLFSDIWFEETSRGQVNREYLVDFFRRLHDQLAVEVVERRSRLYSLARLREIY